MVGGTKQVDWAQCEALKPDLVVFDREENLKEMADSCPFPWHATHVTSVAVVADELSQLADLTSNSELRDLADGWRELTGKPSINQLDYTNVPGQITRLNEPLTPPQRIEYMIWRDPWMSVGPGTFISSMLDQVGFKDMLEDRGQPYPTLEAADIGRDDTFYLFSSEPFPFERYADDLKKQGITGAIVDGEFYSWFGIRSYSLLRSFLLKASLEQSGETT